MSKSVKELGIAGVYLIESHVFRDHRGEFMQAYTSEEGPTYVQENLSFSLKGTFRGMHLQRRNPQGKLVRAVHGVVVDYFLDLRADSPTFKQIGSVYLRGPHVAVYVPPGVAHGFYSVTDSTVYYKCTTHYDKQSDGGVRYNDPEIQLHLPDQLRHISPKDLVLPTMMDYLVKGE